MTDKTPETPTSPAPEAAARSWLSRILASGWFWCPLVIAATLFLIWDQTIEAVIASLPEDDLVRIGVGVFVTLAVIPFLFPRTLAFHRKFELSAILAGGFVAVVTAILLV